MTETSAARHQRDGLRLLTARPGLRALLISALCMVVGAFAFLVMWGVEVETEDGVLPPLVVMLLVVDLLVGIAAAIAVGPVKGSRVGNLAIVAAAPLSTWALAAWVVSVVRLGTRRSYAFDATVVAITALGGVGMTLLSARAYGRPPENLLMIFALGAVVSAAVLMWGRVRGTRAALVTALRSQALASEQAHAAAIRTREAEIAGARAEERSRIARDMHDGISHQLAIVAMHAGALSYRGDLEPEEQRTAATTVRAAAAEASGMLRDALTALRDDDDTRPTSPLPTAASVETLAEATRKAGHLVTVEWIDITVTDLSLDPVRATTLARIAEELFMNARKYAPVAPIQVEIEGSDGAVVLRMENPIVAAPPLAIGTGLGLVGVTERAQMLGGTAEFGATPDGRYVVEVRLP